MKTLATIVFLLFFSTEVFALSATLNWRDNSDNEEGFDIERQLPAEDTWSLLAIVPTDVTQFRDDFSLDGMCYRVRAFLGTDFSGYSNIACAVGTESPSDLTIQSGDLLDARMVTREGLPVSIKRHKRANGRIEILIGNDIEMEINGQRVP